MGSHTPNAADNASTATAVEIESGNKKGDKEKGKWKHAPLRGTCKGRWKVLIRSDSCGLVLRSPHDTEPDAVVDGDGRAAAALRRAAADGVVVPDAAAQQMRLARHRHRPGGVNHAGNWIVGVEILAPLPHVAKHVI